MKVRETFRAGSGYSVTNTRVLSRPPINEQWTWEDPGINTQLEAATRALDEINSCQKGATDHELLRCPAVEETAKERYPFGRFVTHGSVTMATTLDVNLEKIAELSIEDQELVDEVVHKRIIESKREEISTNFKDTLEDHKKGRTKTGSAAGVGIRFRAEPT